MGRPTLETRDRPPSPILNNELFEIDGSLRSGLKEGIQHDYQTLEQVMWEFFVQNLDGRERFKTF